MLDHKNDRKISMNLGDENEMITRSNSERFEQWEKCAVVSSRSLVKGRSFPVSELLRDSGTYSSGIIKVRDRAKSEDVTEQAKLERFEQREK